MTVTQADKGSGGGDDRLAEHAAPLADRAVAGDHYRAALIAARDQLEEQMRGLGGQTGSRPAAPKDLGSASAYMFEAVCPSAAKRRR